MTKDDLNKKREARIKKIKRIWNNIDSEERGEIFAALIVKVEETGEVLEDLLKLVKTDKKPTAAEIKEIEDTLSLGPAWLNFTRKVKRRKN